MTIHKEGYPTIIIGILFSLILGGSAYRLIGEGPILWCIIITLFVLMAIILQFFRLPSRQLQFKSANDVIAPADGKVVVIEDTIETEYFEDERLMISIFMSPINVHSNRNPVSGKIAYEKYHPGKYLVAWHPKSSTENERHTTVYKTGEHEILIRQIAGALARRIVNYTKVGDEVNKGGEMGFIKFGSRVDIYLPVGTEYHVKIGDQVRWNKNRIATLGDPA